MPENTLLAAVACFLIQRLSLGRNTVGAQRQIVSVPSIVGLKAHVVRKMTSDKEAKEAPFSGL